jgi:hypothetical protein
MKIHELTPRDMDEFPRVLEEGVLYISEECELAAHKCCCGCGEDVITPLNPARWRLNRQGGRVSLHPSIGNWKFACRSHYWIRNNRVIPSYGMDDEEIAEIIELDRMDREDFFAQLRQTLPSSDSQVSAQKPQRWLARLLKRLWSWM